MASDNPTGSEVPALKSLRRRFAMALSDVTFKTAGEASSLLKKARRESQKREIIEAQFAAWTEGCGAEIRKFFPQYIELGLAYSDIVKSEIVEWAGEMAWIPLCGQCGVRKYGEFHPPRHRSHSVIWWLGVSIDGNFSVNQPGQKPWCAPSWLAANLRETNELVADWSDRLSGRFFGVLDEEMETARVKSGNLHGVLAASEFVRQSIGRRLFQPDMERVGEPIPGYPG